MKKQKRVGGSPAMRTKKEHEKNRKAQVYMDNHKDKMKPKNDDTYEKKETE